jgi:hypothetical protein
MSGYVDEHWLTVMATDSEAKWSERQLVTCL